MREQTNGKELESLDGSFLRPFLGAHGAERVHDAFAGMSDAFRLAQEMQRAMSELLPGARPRGVRSRRCVLRNSADCAHARSRFGTARARRRAAAARAGSEDGRQRAQPARGPEAGATRVGADARR